MSAFFGLIGFFAIIVGIVLVIRDRKKEIKNKNKKWILIGGAIFFIIGLAIPIDETEDVVAEDQEEETKEVVEEEEEVEEPVKEEEPVEEIEEPVEEESPELVNPIVQLDSTQVEQDLKAQAELDWEGDYEMQDYQYENQLSSYNSLLNLVIDEDYKETLLNNAHSDWPGDYEMIKYQYDNQITSYNWVQEQNLDSDVKTNIMDTAKADWGSDYEMIKYQYENQLEAYNN